MSDQTDPQTEMPKKPKLILSQNQLGKLRYIYICALIVWLIIFLVVGFWNQYAYLVPVFPKFLLCIPFIFLFANFCGLDKEDEETEKNVDWVDMIPTAYVIVFLIFRDFKVKAPMCHFLNAIVGFILILTILFSVDVWAPHDQLIYYKHMRSIVWTMAAGLLIFVGYIFYVTIQKERCV